MPQVIVDPDEVRKFATLLRQTVDDVRGKKSAVSTRFHGLKAVWRDQKYAQFDRTFTEILSGLDRFLRSADSYSDYLHRKVRPIYRYLGQR